MSTRPRLIVQQADLTYVGRVNEPSFRLLPNNLKLVEGLIEALRPFGAQIENLSTSISATRPSESNFSVIFLGGYATAQVSPLGLEITFRGPGRPEPVLPFLLPVSELGRIIGHAAGVIEGSGEAAPIKVTNHVFRVDAHGVLEGIQPMEFLSRLVLPPPAPLAKPQALSLRYGFGAAESRLGSWVVVEPSVRITPGLFLSGAVTLDGALVGASEAADKAREYLLSLIGSSDFPLEVSDE